MTAAVWVALLGAVGVLVGQWATGRLFARLKAIEERQEQIDTHLKSTDSKVEAINAEGSERHDKVQGCYWTIMTRLTVMETLEKERQKQPSSKEGTQWKRS